MISRYLREMIAIRPTIQRAPTILLATLVILIVLGGLVVWTTAHNDHEAMVQETAHLQDLTVSIKDRLTTGLNERYGDLVLLQNTLNAVTVTTKIDTYFQTFLSSYPVYNWVGIVDGTYQIVASSNPLPIPSQTLAQLFAPHASLAQPMGVIAQDPETPGEQALYLQIPLLHPGTPRMRFVLASIPLKSLELGIRNTISQIQNTPMAAHIGYAVFLSSQPKPDILSSNITTFDLQPILQQIAKTPSSLSPNPTVWTEQGVILLSIPLTTRIAGSDNWHLLLTVEQQNVLSSYTEQHRLLLILTGIIGVLFFLVLLHVYRCLHSSYTEHQSTAAALADSEADAQLLINSSLDAIVTINDLGHVTQWNQQAERIFGWTAQEMLGESLSDRIIPTHYRDAHERGLTRIRTEGTGTILNQRLELSALNRKGHQFPIELAIVRVRRRQNTFYTAFIRDLTDIKRSAQQDHIHSIINELLAGSTHFEGTCTQILKTVCEQLQWNCGILWIRDPQRQHPLLRSAAAWHDDTTGLIEFLGDRQATLIRLGEELPGRHWISQKAGTYHSLDDPQTCGPRSQDPSRYGLNQAVILPLVLQNDVYGVLEFYRTDPRTDIHDLERVLNITGGLLAQFIDRVTKSEAIQLSEERFALAVQGSSDGLYDWNILTDEVYFTPRFKALLRYTDGEFPDRFNAFRDHLHPDELTNTLDAIHHHLETKAPFDREVRLRTKDWAYRWFRIRGEAIWDSKNRPLRMAGAITDITQKRNEAEALHTALAAAEAASVAKTQFLAMMSHELRTPLNPVIALADLLTKTLQNKQEREHAQLILSSAKSLLLLINRVLDCAKLEHGDLTLQQTTFDLPGLIHESAKLFRTQAANKGLEMRVVIDPTAPTMVLGDRDRIHQILNNLLGNAVKFTQSGHVTVSVRPTNAPMTATITVQDTGIGIDPAHHALIFQPFTQVDTSTTRAYEGTGLGLSIAHQLTTLMQGTLTLDSAVGRGTTFILRLPLQLISGKQTPTLPAVTSQPLDRRPVPLTLDTILIVDDNMLNCVVTQTMLNNLGYQSEIAASGKAGFDRLQTQRYALVFLDIQMPDLDGLTFLKHWRQIERERQVQRTPIVALTAKAMRGDRQLCLDGGADDYLAKPCTIDDYRRILQRWLAPTTSQTESPLAPFRHALDCQDFETLQRLALDRHQTATNQQQHEYALIYAGIATQAMSHQPQRVSMLLTQLEATLSTPLPLSKS